jgi:hypothetical protein
VAITGREETQSLPVLEAEAKAAVSMQAVWGHANAAQSVPLILAHGFDAVVWEIRALRRTLEQQR